MLKLKTENAAFNISITSWYQPAMLLTGCGVMSLRKPNVISLHDLRWTAADTLQIKFMAWHRHWLPWMIATRLCCTHASSETLPVNSPSDSLLSALAPRRPTAAASIFPVAEHVAARSHVKKSRSDAHVQTRNQDLVIKWSESFVK